MQSYRLYCLDGGRIIKGEWLDAPGDAEAIESARSKNSDVDCELWLGKRLVARLPKGGAAVGVDPPDGPEKE